MVRRWSSLGSWACARALIGVMTYSFARISAVVGMKVEDY